ncbi:MAG: putative quinol monooxygenase [Spirochaetaceae bacterium]|nr:putative quinol monooxygenase [Spirochaetaceae bacterium]
MMKGTMLHVIVTMNIKPGRLDDFLALARQLAPLVHAEQGCIRYDYTLDTASPLSIQGEIDDHRVTLIEQWESPAALAAHLQAPHMKQYGPAMGALRTGEVSARVTRPIDGV